MSQPVVYVHGLWMPGEESLILRRRLANGFDLALQAFRYSAASSSMGEITGHLDSKRGVLSWRGLWPGQPQHPRDRVPVRGVAGHQRRGDER